MQKLSHTIIQVGTTGANSSELEIIVDYDPAERTVERILTVRTFNYENDSHTDITAIMLEHYEEALDTMVDSINWPEIYADMQIEKEAQWN